MRASISLENRRISQKAEVHPCACGGRPDLQRAVSHALVPRDGLRRSGGRNQLPGESGHELRLVHVCCVVVQRVVCCQDDRGAVMECGGQLQGIQWYSFGCSNPPDPSTYSRICQYTRWMRDVMRNNSPTSAPTTTLPPTTPPPSVKEGAEGVQPVQGAL